ncbi:MAG: hypothetical protein RJB68_2506 [Pseudomonadota bacterium]|jgi:hypothetical protein
MNKNELEARRAGIGAQKFGVFVDLLTNAMKYVLIAFLGYMFFDTLKALGNNNPASIEALGGLVEKMKVSTIAHSILTAGLGGAWYLERKGKKRAIRKLAEHRHGSEAKDPYNASSDLDAEGNTPA